MSSVASQSVFPPETSLDEIPARSDAGLHLVLLLCTLEAAYLLRFHGPPSMRHFFEPMALRSFADVSLLLASLLAAVIIHEGGHLVTALSFGFEFMGACLGPWRLQILHGKKKLSFWPQRLLDAAVSASPRQLESWRRDMMIVAAAGPAATLLAALTGACTLNELTSGQSSLLLFFTFFVQMNVLLFVLGLVPNSPRARARNDMRLFLMLARKGAEAAEIELTVQLTQLVNNGIRPQDYPKELMTRLAQWRGRPEGELMFANAMVRWAMDSDERMLAESWDRRALALSEHCDFRLRNHAQASSACIDVLFRDDFEAARSKFAQVKTEMLFPKCFEYRARAARQIALGRNSKAATEIIRAQYALPQGIVAYDLERKLLENLHFRVLTATRRAENLSRMENAARSASCGG